MSKEKITKWVPIHADVKFSCEKPDGWDKMTNKEKLYYFIENMEHEGYICHHCANYIETEFAYNEEWVNKYGEDLFNEKQRKI